MQFRNQRRGPDPSFTARDRPLTGAVPDESHLQDAAGHFEDGNAERQV